MSTEPQRNPDSSEPPDPEQSPLATASESSESVPESTGQAADDQAAEGTDEESGDEGEGLPEYEPLTPELVEDEALRGDFVLRWAVVLLAFLLGSTRIAETATLVHVRSGQYLAAHGFLPPRTDVFSSTAADRTWVNLSWLFDLLLAGVYSLGGMAGLSVLKGLLSAAAFGIIVHIGVRGVPTWWTAICAAAATLAASPRMTAQPEVITLLGVAVTLYLLHQFREQVAPRRLWLLAPLFLLWTNLDSRMFVGLVLLIAYGLGELLAALTGRPSLSSSGARKQYWLVVAGCIVAAMIHPFGWRSVTAPITLYSVEYPALRGYATEGLPGTEWQYSPLTLALWPELRADPSFIALAALTAVALVTIVLNARRLDLGHVLMFVAACGLAACGLHEAGAAAVVLSVLAAWNGQQWYLAGFRQEYSLDWRELVFSRLGRAATVVAFSALAIWAGTGRLRGAQGARQGFGLDPRLESAVDGLAEQLTTAFDDRPFHFRMTQGDMLIWCGARSFIDSRVVLFSGEGDADLLELHKRTREALRSPAGMRAADGGGLDPGSWRRTFERFDITQAVVRLTGRNPDYITLFELLGRPRTWQLTSLGSSSAIFARRDAPGAELSAYLREHQVDLLKEAYRNELEPLFRVPVDAVAGFTPGKVPPALEEEFAANGRRLTPTAEIKKTPQGWAISEPIESQRYRLSVEGDQVQVAGTATLRGRLEWPRGPSFYEKYLWLRFNDLPNTVREAAHLVKLSSYPAMIPQVRSAAALLAVRRAQAGLQADPNNGDAYLALGRAYATLMAWDRGLLGGAELGPSLLRYGQAVQSYTQAFVADPSLADGHYELFFMYMTMNRLDLALRELETYEALAPLPDDPSDEQLQRQREHTRIREELQSRIQPINEALDADLQKGLEPLVVAGRALQQGCVLKALEVLNQNLESLRGNAEAEHLRGLLMLETGPQMEAWQALTIVQEVARNSNLPGWRDTAALSELAKGDYEAALGFWREEAESIATATFSRLLGMAPRFLTEQSAGYDTSPPWPIPLTQAALEHFAQAPARLTSLKVNQALINLEIGHLEESLALFREAIADDPETALRPLIRAYLVLLADEVIDELPPSETIPVLFAEEAALK